MGHGRFQRLRLGGCETATFWLGARHTADGMETRRPKLKQMLGLKPGGTPRERGGLQPEPSGWCSLANPSPQLHRLDRQLRRFLASFFGDICGHGPTYFETETGWAKNCTTFSAAMRGRRGGKGWGWGWRWAFKSMLSHDQMEHQNPPVTLTPRHRPASEKRHIQPEPPFYAHQSPQPSCLMFNLRPPFWRNWASNFRLLAAHMP